MDTDRAATVHGHRFKDGAAALTARAERLADSNRLGLPMALTRRFFAIGGLDLGGLLAIELFTTVIPLMLIGYSWATHWNANLSFGTRVVDQLNLTGEEARMVSSTFGTSASMKSAWTVFGLASFLVWGIPMASQVAKVFALAWRRERFPFLHEVWRGGVWFVLFLVVQGSSSGMTVFGPDTVLDYVRNGASLLPGFFLWSLSPVILIRNGGVGWRYLAWAGVAGVVIDGVLVRFFTRLFFPILLSGWTGFGPIGVAMTLMTYCGVIAVMWVITACFGAVLWERSAPTDVVVSAQDGGDDPGSRRR